MAGNQLPTAIDLAQYMSGLALSQQPVGPSDDLAVRARAWFLEALNHDLWRNYNRESKEDLGFYLGGEGQWTVDGQSDDLHLLKEEGRAIVSINHCQALVEVLTGFERQNRFDAKASPQGGTADDEEGAELWTLVLKWAQDRAEIPEYKSEGFEDGVVRGMSCFYIGLDWTYDPVHGEIKFEVLTPGEDIIWDPRWVRYDLSDARFVIRYKWAYVHDLIAMYPEHKQALIDAVTILSPHAANVGAGGLSSDGSGQLGGAYGVVRGHPLEAPGVESLFWDPKEQRALLMEVWYRDYETRWIVVNDSTNDVTAVETKAEADAMIKSDPENLTAVRRMQRVIRMGTVLPATFQVLEEEDSPFENDLETYPFVPYVAKRKGDTVYGIIRNVKDPQRVENRRISQILDILAKFAAIKPMYEEDSLVDPRSLEDQHDGSPVVVRRGRQAPGWYAPPLAELSRVLTELALQSKLHIREVTGINTDLLGFRSDDTSGIAIARRQAQGQVISTSLFDNFKRTSKLIAHRLARRCQQKFTKQEIIRLAGPTGSPMTITMNPQNLAQMQAKQPVGGPPGSPMGAQDGNVPGSPQGEMTNASAEEHLTGPGFDNRPRYIKSVEHLKYDIVLSDAPSTPSARQMALLALLEVIGKLPEVAPALVDIIVDLADIPEKQKVIKRLQQLLPEPIKAMEGIQSPQPPMPPGMPPGGPGGPPGGPPMPGGPGGPGGPPPPPGMMPPGGPPPMPPVMQRGVPPGQPPVPLPAPPRPPMAPARPPRRTGVSPAMKRAAGAATGGPATGAAPVTAGL